MIKFNGVELPAPNSIEYEYKESVREREALSGRMVRLVLRRKEDITCTWQQLEKAKAMQVLSATAVDKGTLTSWSQKQGEYITKEVYVAGDTSASVIKARLVNENDMFTVNRITITFREA